MADLSRDAQAAAPATISAAERRLVAVELRKNGLSYRKIADRMKQIGVVGPRYAPKTARADVLRALADITAKLTEEAQEVRRLEVMRLEDLLGVYFPKAMEGDYGSLDRVMPILHRLSVLAGVDTPQRVDVTTDGSPLPAAAPTVLFYIPDNNRPAIPPVEE